MGWAMHARAPSRPGLFLLSRTHSSARPFSNNSCDCPNHKVSNTTWPGTPALAPSLASNFGAALTGQFLVSRPAGGVAGEGPDLFPTASDYHLVCLQHDGAASLTVDGAAVYEGGLSAEAAAGESKDEGESEVGSTPLSTPPFMFTLFLYLFPSPPLFSLSLSPQGFKQYCAPVMLTPGWHDVSIKYGNSPRLAGRAASSVLRLFVIDAAQVRKRERERERELSGGRARV